MSQENVDVVTGSLMLDPSADYVPLFRDAATWEAMAQTIAPNYHENAECRMHRFDGESRYTGLEGLRMAWLDWLAPWASYRVEGHDPVDLGNIVLLPAYNLARLDGSAEEIRMDGAAVFTFREGKVARLEFYVDRMQALKALGLEK